MRNFLIIVVSLMITMSGFAQRATMSVCGIKMGTPKEDAKSMLRDRFGYSAVGEESGNLTVYDGSVGGISHQFMTFYFAWINGKSLFNGALLSTPFELSQQKEAIDHREIIKSVYERKYDIVEYKNDDGFKSYWFEKYGELCGYTTIQKSKSKDGKTRLYTVVFYYGPYSETDDI